MFLFRSKSSNFVTYSSILVAAGFLDPPLFFSSMEVRLNGCLTTCHPERLLRKTINCSIVPRFALLMSTVAHWPGDSRNYHVLRALKLSSKIFCIYVNPPAVWLFHAVVIVFSLFYDHFCNYINKEKRYKVKTYTEVQFFLIILWNLRS